jgi:hypothetical protein
LEYKEVEINEFDEETSDSGTGGDYSDENNFE